MRHQPRNKAKAIAISQQAETQARAQRFFIALGSLLLLGLFLSAGLLTSP